MHVFEDFEELAITKTDNKVIARYLIHFGLVAVYVFIGIPVVLIFVSRMQ